MTRIRNFFQEKAEEWNVKIFLVNKTKNQMHALLSDPPTIGIVTLVRHLQGYSSGTFGKNIRHR